jgi:hypothetical protein
MSFFAFAGSYDQQEVVAVKVLLKTATAAKAYEVPQERMIFMIERKR